MRTIIRLPSFSSTGADFIYTSTAMYISDFVSYLRYEQNRSPLTVEAYERDLLQFIDWLTCFHPERFDPRDVTLNDIRAWLTSLARTDNTPRTLRRKAQSLRAFFRHLLKKGAITINPAADLSLPKLPKRLPDVVRADEIESILSPMDEALAETPDNETLVRDDIYPRHQAGGTHGHQRLRHKPFRRRNKNHRKKGQTTCRARPRQAHAKNRAMAETS